jgi:AmmeMemoRadiSam system protein A
VCEIAEKAALEDPRFEPVEKEELAQISLSISVMSPVKEIHAIEEIEIGTHGLILSTSFTRGLLLPKVAVEQHWDRERFLDETALKAGLPRGSWRKPGVTISVFTTEDFSEKGVRSENNRGAKQ